MKHFELTYKPYGERSILVEWPSKIDENILKDIILFKKKIKNKYIKEIVDINIAYNSLLISYNDTINNLYDAFSELKALYLAQYTEKKSTKKLWKIPVCYSEKYGLDLQNFSKEKNLSSEEITRLHSAPIYTVFFIGFLPGFLYLGGLDKELILSRKSTPNLQIKKGSVAIGGEQTGIYPQNSPGGWHIIGNSPINFFDSSLNEPCFAQSGDKLQLFAVNEARFLEIESAVNNQSYVIESEVIDD